MTFEDRLREALHAAARSADPPEGPDALVEPHAAQTSGNLRRFSVIAAALGLSILTVALLLIAFDDGRQPGRTPATSPSPSESDPPVVTLTLQCLDSGVAVNPEEVPLARDGLHLHLLNSSGTPAVAVIRPAARPGGRSAVILAEVRADREVTVPSMPPGTYEAACMKNVGERIVMADIDETLFTARFAVTDPLGYWSQVKDDEHCGEPLPSPASTAGTAAPLSAPVSGRMLVNGDSSQTSDDDIFSVEVAGSGSSRVTDEGASSGGRWSPDGSRIAYSGDLLNDVTSHTSEAGHSELYSSADDGSDVQKITDNRSEDLQPSWSPDGQRIAFTSNEGGPRALWIVSADGSDPNQVPIAMDIVDSPAWSPDGAWIAFVGYQEREPGQPCFDGELFTVRPDGSDLQQLTDDELYQGSPAWSPDGSRLAYTASNQSDYSLEIFSMAANGADVQRLTNSPAYDADPLWSPDGQLITFVSDRLSDGSAPSDGGGSPGPLSQYVMNADGSGVRVLFDARIVGLTADDSVTATGWRA